MYVLIKIAFLQTFQMLGHTLNGNLILYWFVICQFFSSMSTWYILKLFYSGWMLILPYWCRLKFFLFKRHGFFLEAIWCANIIRLFSSNNWFPMTILNFELMSNIWKICPNRPFWLMKRGGILHCTQCIKTLHSGYTTKYDDN